MIQNVQANNLFNVSVFVLIMVDRSISIKVKRDNGQDLDYRTYQHNLLPIIYVASKKEVSICKAKLFDYLNIVSFNVTDLGVTSYLFNQGTVVTNVNSSYDSKISSLSVQAIYQKVTLVEDDLKNYLTYYFSQEGNNDISFLIFKHFIILVYVYTQKMIRGNCHRDENIEKRIFINVTFFNFNIMIVRNFYKGI